jgi:L-serine deaminase
MAAKPDQSYPLTLGDKTFSFRSPTSSTTRPRANFPHPNTDDLQAHGRRPGALEQEYYSSAAASTSGRGYQPPKKGSRKYSYATMKELRKHAEDNKLSIPQVIMANEIAVSGKTEEQINAFLDKIGGAMLATVKSGLSVKEGVLPGPIKLHSKAATVWARAMDDKYESDRAIALVSACALAASEENARGHLVITAPTGGSAGVMPAIVYAMVNSKPQTPQGEDPPGSARGSRHWLPRQAQRHPLRSGGWMSVGDRRGLVHVGGLHRAGDGQLALVVENAAESALEHHLGMTCDPVAGYVQVPCIERCAFGAVKAWTAYMIATNEIASRHRVDLDTTIKTLAQNGEGHERRSTRKRARAAWPPTSHSADKDSRRRECDAADRNEGSWRTFSGSRGSARSTFGFHRQTTSRRTTGEADFLVEPTARTRARWERLQPSFREESHKGRAGRRCDRAGVADVPRSGYIDRDNEVIVGLQTDKPFRRRSCRSAAIAWSNPAEVDRQYDRPAIRDAFTKYRKTTTTASSICIRRRSSPAGAPTSSRDCRMPTARAHHRRLPARRALRRRPPHRSEKGRAGRDRRALAVGRGDAAARRAWPTSSVRSPT